MTLKKQDLREAYNNSIGEWSNTTELADDFIVYLLKMLILSGIINVVLVSFVGLYGAIFAFLINLYIMYMISKKLFENVDELVVNRIDRREKELLESIEEE